MIIAVGLATVLTLAARASFAQAATTFSGQAVALKASAVGVSLAVSETGALPSTGGSLSRSVASVSVAGRASADLLSTHHMDSELERLRERIRELEVANEALRQNEHRLASEQETLQQVTNRLITAQGTEALYQQVLDTALAIMQCDFASIQMFYPRRGANGELRLLGHRGFGRQAAKRWEWVSHSTRTTCGEALRTGRRVVVPDVRTCDFMAGSEDLDGLLEAGISAAQSTPLVSRSGALLGMVTTYWREPHELSSGEQGSLDILARLAGDLVEQRQTEERLRASEARLVSAQRLAKLGSWERDDLTGNSEFSDQMLRILGMPEHPPLTLSAFLYYVHPEDRVYVWAGALRARATGSPVEGEYRIVRTDGEVRVVRSILEAIRDESGRVIRVVGATQDITDLKRAQEETTVRQKLESVGTLASGIAHDFNNLLGGVLTQAELALDEYQAGSSPEQELKRIRDGAIRGSEIVRQLMIYAGKESETVGLVDVSQVAMGMIELLKVSISKRASVVTDFGPDLPAVRGSAGQIQQIVMNLVTNAAEALGDRDGVIHVATRRVNLDRAAAVSKGITEGEYVLLGVTDTGHGMSWEMQARVFDPFFTTKSEGHGLGLAMVSGIVRGLGGAIHLESEPGKGTTFQIFLRSTGIMTGASGPRPTTGESSPQPVATILVVEDDDALRVALAQILGRRSFETLDAANGTDAINLLRANSIKLDMMLLDMTIPGPSSREVAAVAAEARPGLKVVLTSAYDEKTVRTRVGAPQNCGFIRKPFQIVELVQTLRNSLSLGKAAG